MTPWLSDVLAGLAALAPLELAAAFAVYAAALACRAVAWRNVLAAASGGPVSFRLAAASYFGGGAVNAIVPARAGVALRLALARVAAPRLGWPELTGTLGVEAVFNAAAGAAFMAWGAWTLGGSGVALTPSRTALAVLGAATVAPALLWALRRRAPARVAAALAAAARPLALLGDRRTYLRKVVAWQAADWLARLATIALALRAAGLDHDLRTVLLVQAGLSLAALLPLTPAGAGAKQGAVVLVLAGVAPSATLVAFGTALTLLHALVDVTLGVVVLAAAARAAGSPVEALALLRRLRPTALPPR